MSIARWIDYLTGEYPVYPGHPLVTATMIMERFPNIKEANQKALSCIDITGSGDGVQNGLNLLNSKKAPEEMVTYADEIWIRYQAGGIHERVPSGLAQAEKLKEIFLFKVRKWLNVV